MKPKYIEQRGRKPKYKHPIRIGQVVELPIEARNAARQMAFIKGYKLRTWIVKGVLMVERMS